MSIENGKQSTGLGEFKYSRDFTRPELIRIEEWVDQQLARRNKRPPGTLRPNEESIWDFLTEFDKYVIFEDGHILVVNKPPHIPSHYSPATPAGVEEIVRYYKGDDARLGHRLDRDTTGVLVLAKGDDATRIVREQFSNKSESEMNKVYLALLDGKVFANEPIKAAIRIAPTDTERMRVVSPTEDIVASDRTAKDSLTYFRPLTIFRGGDGRFKTLTEVQIITGRTHQIRVVSADFLGNPVTGDPMYNPSRKDDAPRTMLHAHTLTLKHPATNASLHFESPLPRDFQEVMGRMQVEHSFI